MNITWTEEVASSIKFKGTVSGSSGVYEVTLAQASDASSTTVSLTLNSTNNLGSITFPGDYSTVKAALQAIGDAL